MTPSPPTRADGPGGRPWAALAALLPALLLVALALAAPIASGDLWWHLNTGREILAERALPATDPFSHTAGDRPWILEEYGSQVLLALVDRAGGTAALRVVGALLAVALVVVVWRAAARRVPAAWATFLAALFALLYGLKWELRPQLISAFFLFRAVHVLFGRAAADGGVRPPGRRDWIELFVLTAVWTQLHAEALFVPLLAAAGLIGALLAALLERGGGARVTGWAAALACALAGNLVSPFGLAPIRYALVHRAVPQQYIEEWFPLTILPGDPRFAPLTVGLFVAVVIVFAAGSALVITQALGRLRARSAEAPAIPWERIGLIALCVVLAFQARRFFFLLWFPALESLALTLRGRPALAGARSLPLAAALALALPLSHSHYAALAREADWSEPVNASLLPVHAVDFAAESGLEGNLYHPYEWGGYLGYRLGRACPVFIDGRTVLFADVIEERWRAERNPDYAAEVFAARDVSVIVFKRLVDHGAGATGWRPPGAHRDWIRVWSDELAVVWLRADRKQQLARAIAWWRDRGVELDPARGIVEAQVVAVHPDWVRERRLLPAVVSKALADAPAGDAPEARLDRAELWFTRRMARSARYELDELFDALEESDPLSPWLGGREVLAREGIAAAIAWLRSQPPP